MSQVNYAYSNNFIIIVVIVVVVTTTIRTGPFEPFSTMAGTITSADNNMWNFTPTNNYIGPVSLVYKISDGISPIVNDNAQFIIQTQPA